MDQIEAPMSFILTFFMRCYRRRGARFLPQFLTQIFSSNFRFKDPPIKSWIHGDIQDLCHHHHH